VIEANRMGRAMTSRTPFGEDGAWDLFSFVQLFKETLYESSVDRRNPSRFRGESQQRGTNLTRNSRDKSEALTRKRIFLPMAWSMLDTLGVFQQSAEIVFRSKYCDHGKRENGVETST